jgi:penicillin-binding protein 1A
MKVATGYFFIFLLLPVFFLLAYFSSNEVRSFDTLDHVLENQIRLENSNLSQTSFIKDRNGEIVSEWYSTVNRIVLPSEDIPELLREVFVLSEDQHFYEHIGFDLTAIGRALTINIQSNGIEQGASTITQQLARNLYLTHEQSYNRKLSEILYAYKLEKTYSKKEIIDLYINSIYFQNGAYGIEAAAMHYFSRGTLELTKAELLFLAAVPNNPTYYDPLTHFDRTKTRQERLIDLLVEKDKLTASEATEIKNSPINLSVHERIDQAPDYMTYVQNELSQLISLSEGLTDEEQIDNRVKEVLASGISIETSLDQSLQNRAKTAVSDNLPFIDVEGSVAVIDHTNAQILALVGGKNYQKGEFNRAFQAYRQPGSSIKPLLVYAPYLQETHSSLSKTVNAGELCIGNYCPENYGGKVYGNVTLERAFANSYNTPAVRLLNEIGVETGFRYLTSFPFKKLAAEDHVLPAAVGGFTYGMSALELTGAYTSFYDGGYQQPRAIRKVTDLQGNVLYEWKEEKKQVWSPETVNSMRSLLSETISSGTARKAHLSRATYQGGKTGTTNNYQDYWFVGLTDTLTVGVWVGRDMPSSIENIEQYSPHLYIWKAIMSQ